jgi:hypothetical protein
MNASNNNLKRSTPRRASKPRAATGKAKTATKRASVDRSGVVLSRETLRALRHRRLMSQQDLADDCWRRNIQLSIATIKRAECGLGVRFRVVREFARCFDVSPEGLLA